jgi:hypothetical protein
MKLLQRLIASTPLSGERIATTLLKHLLLFTILMKTLVSALGTVKMENYSILLEGFKQKPKP